MPHARKMMCIFILIVHYALSIPSSLVLNKIQARTKNAVLHQEIMNLYLLTVSDVHKCLAKKKDGFISYEHDKDCLSEEFGSVNTSLLEANALSVLPSVEFMWEGVAFGISRDILKCMLNSTIPQKLKNELVTCLKPSGCVLPVFSDSARAILVQCWAIENDPSQTNTVALISRRSSVDYWLDWDADKFWNDFEAAFTVGALFLLMCALVFLFAMGNCISGDSLLMLDSGKEIAAKNIFIGDEVYVTDNTLSTVWFKKQTVNIFPMITIITKRFDDFFNVTLTGDHLLYNANHHLVKAQDINIGDYLLLGDGTETTCVDIILTYNQTAYMIFTFADSLRINGIKISPFVYSTKHLVKYLPIAKGFSTVLPIQLLQPIVDHAFFKELSQIHKYFECEYTVTLILSSFTLLIYIIYKNKTEQ